MANMHVPCSQVTGHPLRASSLGGTSHHNTPQRITAPRTLHHLQSKQHCLDVGLQQDKLHEHLHTTGHISRHFVISPLTGRSPAHGCAAGPATTTTGLPCTMPAQQEWRSSCTCPRWSAISLPHGTNSTGIWVWGPCQLSSPMPAQQEWRLSCTGPCFLTLIKGRMKPSHSASALLTVDTTLEDVGPMRASPWRPGWRRCSTSPPPTGVSRGSAPCQGPLRPAGHPCSPPCAWQPPTHCARAPQWLRGPAGAACAGPSAAAQPAGRACDPPAVLRLGKQSGPGSGPLAAACTALR